MRCTCQELHQRGRNYAACSAGAVPYDGAAGRDVKAVFKAAGAPADASASPRAAHAGEPLAEASLFFGSASLLSQTRRLHRGSCTKMGPGPLARVTTPTCSATSCSSHPEAKSLSDEAHASVTSIHLYRLLACRAIKRRRCRGASAGTTSARATSAWAAACAARCAAARKAAAPSNVPCAPLCKAATALSSVPCAT